MATQQGTIRIFQHSLSVTSGMQLGSDLAWGHGFDLFSSTDGSSAESASSSEKAVIDTNVVADSEWKLSEGTRSEGIGS